jgi:hypothetical protein
MSKDEKKQSKIEADKCPSCFSINLECFYKIEEFPVHSVLNIYSKKEAINFPRGKITLQFCKNCGFIFNSDFDETLLSYSSDCEESQDYSPTFKEFLVKSTTELVEKYNVYQKDIIEIGCGKGDFLRLICQMGQNRGVGFDPAYTKGRGNHAEDQRITFIKDFYSEKYSQYKGDLVCCRMTLEHIYNTYDFIKTVRNSIGNKIDTIVFFQVPDVKRILKNIAFEDIYYEHCSYFSSGSLSRLFRKCYFDIIDLKTEFEGQYLIIEARPTRDEQNKYHLLENDMDITIPLVKQFKNGYEKIVFHWKNIFSKIKTKKSRTVIWGSGSKGVSFLNTIDIYDEVEYVVDINPYRQDSYMAGTGQKIVAPSFLKEYQPDVVIVMNPVYKDEISKDLNNMGLSPEILTL